MYRFYSGKNELKADLVWQGKTYSAYPVQATGFERSGSGPSNRPTLTLSIYLKQSQALLVNMKNVLEAIVVVIKFMQNISMRLILANGNKSADPNQEIVSNFFIEQLSNLTKETATFTLALPAETINAKILAVLLWLILVLKVYRSSECGYTGNSYLLIKTNQL